MNTVASFRSCCFVPVVYADLLFLSANMAMICDDVCGNFMKPETFGVEVRVGVGVRKNGTVSCDVFDATFQIEADECFGVYKISWCALARWSQARFDKCCIAKAGLPFFTRPAWLSTDSMVIWRLRLARTWQRTLKSLLSCSEQECKMKLVPLSKWTFFLAKASAWAQFGNSSDERTRSSSPRRQSCAVMAGVPSRRIDGN